MSQQPEESQQLITEEVRDRAVLPILIPFAAIVITEIVVFSMSRILLATGGMDATIIAIVATVGIMVGCTAVAMRPRIRSSSITALVIVLLVATIGVGVYAMQQGPFYEGQEDHAAEEAH